MQASRRVPSGAPIQIVATEVSLDSKKTSAGQDFTSINPKGNVPTIVLEDHSVLNENVATLQWIADQVCCVGPAAVPPRACPPGVRTSSRSLRIPTSPQAPASGLAPPWGTSQRYQLVNTLAFLASEVHAGFSPLFNPKLSEEHKKWQQERLKSRLDILATQVLKDKHFLLGDAFTVADSCACVGWGRAIASLYAPARFPRSVNFHDPHVT